MRPIKTSLAYLADQLWNLSSIHKMPCGGGENAVGWPGGFGGWWRADPRDNSVLIFLSHNMVEPEQLANGIGLGVYAAITQFQALVSTLPA